MNAIELYKRTLQQILDRVFDEQRENLEKVAARLCDCVTSGHFLYIFGTGHAHILAEEMFYRAGGLAAVIPILDEPLMLHVSASALEGALIIGLDRSERLVEILRTHGLAVERQNFRHYTNNTAVGWEMVKEGLGIGIMMEEIAAATPGVVRILPEFQPIPVPIWLTTHRELNTSRRIRLVYDFLADELARWTPSA